MAKKKSKVKQTIIENESEITRILKTAAFCFAIVSYFATAYGLENYVFYDHSWQAYLYSFGIQATLFVLSIGLPIYVVKAWGKLPDRLTLDSIDRQTDNKRRLKRERHWRIAWSLIKSAFIVILNLAFLLVSSFFSWVFICEQVYTNTKTDDAHVRLKSGFTNVKSNVEKYVDEKLDEARNNIIREVSIYKTQGDTNSHTKQGVTNSSNVNISDSLKVSVIDQSGNTKEMVIMDALEEMFKKLDPDNRQYSDEDRIKTENKNKDIYTEINNGPIKKLEQSLESLEFTKYSLESIEQFRIQLETIKKQATEDKDGKEKEKLMSTLTYRAGYYDAYIKSYNGVILCIDNCLNRLYKEMASQNAPNELLNDIFSSSNDKDMQAAKLKKLKEDLDNLNEDFMNSLDNAESFGAVKARAIVAGYLDTDIESYLKLLKAKDDLSLIKTDDINAPGSEIYKMEEIEELAETDEPVETDEPAETDEPVETEEHGETDEPAETDKTGEVKKWRKKWKNRINMLIGLVSTLPDVQDRTIALEKLEKELDDAANTDDLEKIEEITQVSDDEQSQDMHTDYPKGNYNSTAKTTEFIDELSDLLRNETNELNALESAQHLWSGKYSNLAKRSFVFALFCDFAAVGGGILIFIMEKKAEKWNADCS